MMPSPSNTIRSELSRASGAVGVDVGCLLYAQGSLPCCPSPGSFTLAVPPCQGVSCPPSSNKGHNSVPPSPLLPGGHMVPHHGDAASTGLLRGGQQGGEPEGHRGQVTSTASLHTNLGGT